MESRKLGAAISPFAQILVTNEAKRATKAAKAADAAKTAKAAAPPLRERIAEAERPASPFAHLRGAAGNPAFGQLALPAPAPARTAAPSPGPQSIADQILYAGRKARGELTEAEIKAERRAASPEDRRAQSVADFILAASSRARGEP